MCGVPSFMKLGGDKAFRMGSETASASESMSSLEEVILKESTADGRSRVALGLQEVAENGSVLF